MAAAAPLPVSDLLTAYRRGRAATTALAAPLSAEDCAVQSMPDASPVKWHLAHTSWFFESMLLTGWPGYRPFDAAFAYLFNSYYEGAGPRHPRPRRGLITRPRLDEVLAYRAHVDAAMEGLITAGEKPELVALGLAHEEQHAELILTDIKHAFFANPLLPAYRAAPQGLARPQEMRWLSHPGGIAAIGHDGPSLQKGFAFDNEMPRHDALLRPFRIASRPVSNGEYGEFIADGGYKQADFWLSDGWARIQQEGWDAPLYWLTDDDGQRRVFSLSGLGALDPNAPVEHVSFFEAAAYAAWRGKRLPTEFEWEAAAPGFAHGAVWEWTRSAYDPYPGFKPFAGLAGEYNGKFMVGQLVLRGGSHATPPGHARPTYRNFFPAATRWQFSGIRLGGGRIMDARRALALPDGVAASGLTQDFVRGLGQPARQLPCKYFYDEEGSRLFEAICELPEYYQTRTETALLSAHADEIAGLVGADAEIVEFGAGALRKVRLLLDRLENPRAYTPLDISGDYLMGVTRALAADYPNLSLRPMVGDFTLPLVLAPAAGPRAGFFPGGTIGNFRPDAAVALLRNLRRMLGGGGLLIGVDLVKDPAILHAAYNDAAGVTAAFNKNLLRRANREAGADFAVEAFAHYAPYNAAAGRIEMYLVSLKRQSVRLGGRQFDFAEGEPVHTEDSHKYTIAAFRDLAAQAGFVPGPVWCDPDGLFSLHWLAGQ